LFFFEEYAVSTSPNCRVTESMRAGANFTTF
jgi:hypothetical protein